MELNLSNLGLKKLPKIPEGITILKCNNNKLTMINGDILPQSLLELYCSDNRIVKIQNLPKNLVKLVCEYNYLDRVNLPPSVKIVKYINQKRLEGGYANSRSFPTLHYDYEPIKDHTFEEGIEIYTGEDPDFM